jgi:HD-GYP domain-containing protein (c-di-GMP phosphodiesterase class II)/DNA-binding CsgD family transcriptional regulator
MAPLQPGRSAPHGSFPLGEAVSARIRLTEVLSALSLTTDLGSGMPFEKGLRTCVVASSFASVLGLSTDQRRAVFGAALLRSLGCTAHAPENAAMFGDDIRFERALKELDPSDPETFSARFGDWDPARQKELLALLIERTPTTGVHAARSGCEVSAALGARLRIDRSAIAALEDVYERWDGRGIPNGRAGDQLNFVARIVHVAEQVVLARFFGDLESARTSVARRAGGQLDPELCAAFSLHSEQVLSALDTPDVLGAVVAAEPPPAAFVDASQLDSLCLALAIFADLKGLHLIGHSQHVAELAAGAARLMGMDGMVVEEIHAAGLLHDLGRTAVSSEIWDRPGPLGLADQERVRLHSYWTERILARCPVVAPLSLAAAAHHERLDGSGYHRGARASEIGPAGRLLAAADVFAALTESRPHRPALEPGDAARELLGEASSGKLDPGVAAAVIQAAGLPRPRSAWPADLTDREVDVLRLCVRGLTNRAIADELVVSSRTVQHHLASIYDKSGRRTRAGAAVFALEHGLATW